EPVQPVLSIRLKSVDEFVHLSPEDFQSALAAARMSRTSIDILEYLRARHQPHTLEKLLSIYFNSAEKYAAAVEAKALRAASALLEENPEEDGAFILATKNISEEEKIPPKIKIRVGAWAKFKNNPDYFLDKSFDEDHGTSLYTVSKRRSALRVSFEWLYDELG